MDYPNACPKIRAAVLNAVDNPQQPEYHDTAYVDPGEPRRAYLARKEEFQKEWDAYTPPAAPSVA